MTITYSTTPTELQIAGTRNDFGSFASMIERGQGTMVAEEKLNPFPYKFTIHVLNISTKAGEKVSFSINSLDQSLSVSGDKDRSYAPKS